MTKKFLIQEIKWLLVAFSIMREIAQDKSPGRNEDERYERVMKEFCKRMRPYRKGLDF